MGSNSQRRKERLAKRRKEKRKQQEQARGRLPMIDRQAGYVLGSNARHRQRLSQQAPLAWPGERHEDAAVFDEAAYAQLTPELREEASAVRDALKDALELRGDEALKRISAIPRGSAFSEWRLFLRGLIDWLSDDQAAAGEAWKRLDPERRPGRIATVMMAALRPDLDRAAPHTETPLHNSPQEEVATTDWNRFDDQQLYHAKLLRRVRFERAALHVAEAGLKIPEESAELNFGPRKMQWLKHFIEEYGDTEPDLAAALSQTALGRAFTQTYSNMFDDAAGMFRGPRHDPKNRLLTFFYFARFPDDPPANRRAEKALRDYLDRDLPQNKALTAALRGAIASHIHLNEARVLMQPAAGHSLFDQMFGAAEDTKAVRNHLLAATMAAPEHGAAYQAHVAWIQDQLDDERLEKTKLARLETELADVMRRWSQGLPNEIEPRLWLVDHLLESEQLEEARPHVEFLAGVRQENPLARATPWKWQLLEAMRLCRRKAWLADVPARLDEAEALWPAWLSKQWLPYLRAAWTLRNGQTDACEEQRRQICAETGRVRDSLADACMMLGAAQQMRVSAAELKPLRAAVDGNLKSIKSRSLDDLLETASFFWDLQRAKLLYPAYRLHAKPIGTALFGRLGQEVKLVLSRIDDERLQQAVLWGSAQRYWSNNYETKLPRFFSQPLIQQHPRFVAAKLNAHLNERSHWNLNRHQHLGPLLREAAQSQRDAYYRYWFVSLADRLDDLIDIESRRFSGFPFGNFFGRKPAEDFDDFDEDDPLGFDPDCDCADCCAARTAWEQAQGTKAK